MQLHCELYWGRVRKNKKQQQKNSDAGGNGIPFKNIYSFYSQTILGNYVKEFKRYVHFGAEVKLSNLDAEPLLSPCGGRMVDLLICLS